ncbi:MAG: peptidase U32 family protein [Pseudomonadota bacterium]
MAISAFEHGADSVYVGPKGWSRRPSTDELSDAEIKYVIEYGNDVGKDVRVAINVMPSPGEIPQFLNKVERYVTWGAGGVMICDPGCIRLVRQYFPEVEIHVSVTAGVFNIEDIHFYRELGANHIVLPYRWGAAEIEEIRGQAEVGLEAFLFQTPHRAWICPGRCYSSSYFRIEHLRDTEDKDYFVGSASRGGSCHRICQGSWTFRDGQKILLQSRRLKSRPELLLWELLEYVEMGVSRFKIPGRERSTEMVCAIVSFYRRALDHVLAGSPDLTAFAPEWEALKARWAAERTRRDDTRIDSAAIAA